MDHQKYDKIGVHECVAAARLPGGGPLSCDYGCLGMGSCEKACPFDAIHVIDGVAKVDVDKCKACNQCVDICPRHIIALEPYKTKKHVSIPCSSKDKGPAVTKVCTNGCIGCSLCAKSCPKEAITMVDNLAHIDYDKCIGCGICAQKCPRKLITVDGKVPVVKPAAPKAAPAAAAKPAAPAAEPAKTETEDKCKACNQCVDICPRHIIALEPYKTKKHVTIPCSSHDKGPAVTKVCSNGCIGCSLCAKSCPKEAITMVNNLAVIDYDKCIGCGICAQKCPRKLITVDGKVPEPKPAAPKAAPAAKPETTETKE